MIKHSWVVGPWCHRCWGRGELWANMAECSRDSKVEVKIEDCLHCEKTGRDEIPWTELFTAGRDWKPE